MGSNTRQLTSDIKNSNSNIHNINNTNTKQIGVMNNHTTIKNTINGNTVGGGDYNLGQVVNPTGGNFVVRLLVIWGAALQIWFNCNYFIVFNKFTLKLIIIFLSFGQKKGYKVGMKYSNIIPDQANFHIFYQLIRFI